MWSVFVEGDALNKCSQVSVSMALLCRSDSYAPVVWFHFYINQKTTKNGDHLISNMQHNALSMHMAFHIFIAIV